jgi:hypothetical protein
MTATTPSCAPTWCVCVCVCVCACVCVCVRTRVCFSTHLASSQNHSLFIDADRRRVDSVFQRHWRVLHTTSTKRHAPQQPVSMAGASSWSVYTSRRSATRTLSHNVLSSSRSETWCGSCAHRSSARGMRPRVTQWSQARCRCAGKRKPTRQDGAVRGSPFTALF